VVFNQTSSFANPAPPPPSSSSSSSSSSPGSSRASMRAETFQRASVRQVPQLLLCDSKHAAAGKRAPGVTRRRICDVAEGGSVSRMACSIASCCIASRPAVLLHCRPCLLPPCPPCLLSYLQARPRCPCGPTWDVFQDAAAHPRIMRHCS